eukprot:5247003-Pleurochrysis_carterae.AAC.3
MSMWVCPNLCSKRGEASLPQPGLVGVIDPPSKLVTRTEVDGHTTEAQPIRFHRALAETGAATWPDLYDTETVEYYKVAKIANADEGKITARLKIEYRNVKTFRGNK